MARSTYIYVVMRSALPLAAFTVRHELVSWVSRHADDLLLHGGRVYRCRDNGDMVEEYSMPWWSLNPTDGVVP